jgi:large subunit ribosomal protein L35
VPKIKTHSGSKKRFKITGTGKVLHERANKRHLLESKSSRRTRRLSGTKELVKADARKVERLLGKR